MHSAVFLESAERIGRSLASAAIEHDGRATWLADAYCSRGGMWRRSTATLAGDLGSGTAGVGLFLAHIGHATAQHQLSDTGLSAIRHALSRADALIAASRFGWYDGALGVTIAAAMTGRLLGREDVMESAGQLGTRVMDALDGSGSDPQGGLLSGSAGVLAGLLAATCQLSDVAQSERAHRLSMSRWALDVSSDAFVNAGLGRGNSGAGLVLLALAVAGNRDAATAAAQALDAERRWFEPLRGWWCDIPHAWHAWDADAHVGTNRAWCAGAAGIGIARLLAYRVLHEPRFLAEASAAVQFICEDDAGDESDPDASVCHGWAGHLELLLLASSLLSQPLHRDVARMVARRHINRAEAGYGYESGLWPGARTPALLHGLAGTGLTLLRLHDATLAPSPALPFCFPDAVLNSRAPVSRRVPAY